MTQFARISIRHLLVGLVCFMVGGIAAFWIRKWMNPYVGSLVYGQVWFISITGIIVGLLATLKMRWRPWGITLILMGASVVIGLLGVSAFVPSQTLQLQPIVHGPFVRVQFRNGTTGDQEFAFLCNYVYSECTPSGQALRTGVVGMVRTQTNELTILTTEEFQQAFLDLVKRAPIVEVAEAGSA